MAIEIRERFEVKAPVQHVWEFLLDPERVAPCMPGASLDAIVDETTFEGSVRVRVGAITTRYQGRVRLTDVNEAERTVQMVAEGRETGGGTARATLTGRLEETAPGTTEVVMEASVDLTGRLMQLGRGMIGGVAHQLFLRFASEARQRIEASSDSAQLAVPLSSHEPAPLRVVPLAVRVLWSRIRAWLRSLFGRSPS